MNLTWRLIISYVVIILVTLSLALLTLIIVARPIQNRLATTRLMLQSRQAARQINNLYRQGASIEQLANRLNGRQAQANSRLILIDPRGIALVDTAGSWTGQQLALLNSDQNQAPLSNSSGSFTGPGGDAFNYALAPIGADDSPAGYVATVAERAPAVSRIITELGGGFIFAGLVALFVSLLVGVFIARSIALPLQRIAGAAGAVAAGEYHHRVPEAGPPEVKRVAASFNLMAGQVAASQEAMRDFVSNVSHELKTPLTSIQGFSQAIMEGATQDEPTRRRAAGIIYEEAARMTRLVGDLLDLARIDSGQVMMHKTPLDMAQILNSAYDRLLPQAVKREVDLVKAWQRLPPIVGDGDRLAQVFTNLLDNAIRHTPSGGRVTVVGKITKGVPRQRKSQTAPVQADVTTVLSERNDFVEINVTDTGPGIPQEDLARIFERFYQVDKSRKRGGGTGLGLAIIKEIVEAHSGYVRAESVVGVGTKFTVLLPITEADAQTLISSRREPL